MVSQIKLMCFVALIFGLSYIGYAVIENNDQARVYHQNEQLELQNEQLKKRIKELNAELTQARNDIAVAKEEAEETEEATDSSKKED